MARPLDSVGTAEYQSWRGRLGWGGVGWGFRPNWMMVQEFSHDVDDGCSSDVHPQPLYTHTTRDRKNHPLTCLECVYSYTEMVCDVTYTAVMTGDSVACCETGVILARREGHVQQCKYYFIADLSYSSPLCSFCKPSSMHLAPAQGTRTIMKCSDLSFPRSFVLVLRTPFYAPRSRSRDT